MNEHPMTHDPGCRVVIKTFGEVVLETCDKPIVARVEYLGVKGVGLCKRHKTMYYEWKTKTE